MSNLRTDINFDLLQGSEERKFISKNVWKPIAIKRKSYLRIQKENKSDLKAITNLAYSSKILKESRFILQRQRDIVKKRDLNFNLIQTMTCLFCAGHLSAGQ